MIERLVKKFRTTGSVLDKKKRRKRSVLTEEKFDETGASLEKKKSKEISDMFICTMWCAIGIYSHSNETSEIATTLLFRDSLILTVVLGFISVIGCWNLCMTELLIQNCYFLVMKHGCI
jgi:hypothetical protein